MNTHKKRNKKQGWKLWQKIAVVAIIFVVAIVSFTVIFNIVQNSQNQNTSIGSSGTTNGGLPTHYYDGSQNPNDGNGNYPNVYL